MVVEALCVVVNLAMAVWQSVACPVPEKMKATEDEKAG